MQMNNKMNLPEMIRITAFFTGHRILNKSESGLLRNRILDCLSEAYQAGYRRFYCGGALGFDTIAALQTISFREQHPDVKLLMAVPCATQADLWHEKDKEVYRNILNLADEKVVLSPVYYRGVMLTRNRYMADRSSLCICYLQNIRGGTASTVRYALLHDRIRIINLAVDSGQHPDLLREGTWNYTFTSLSAGRNAVIAPLRLMSDRKVFLRNT